MVGAAHRSADGVGPKMGRRKAAARACMTICPKRSHRLRRTTALHGVGMKLDRLADVQQSSCHDGQSGCMLPRCFIEKVPHIAAQSRDTFEAGLACQPALLIEHDGHAANITPSCLSNGLECSNGGVHTVAGVGCVPSPIRPKFCFNGHVLPLPLVGFLVSVRLVGPS